MSLGQTIAKLVKANMVPAKGSQIAVIRKRDDTFDQDAGEWIAGVVTDYPVTFAADAFSDFLKASGTLVGDQLIHVPAKLLDFEPYVGGSEQRDLEIYFGDWTDLASADVSSAARTGVVKAVDRAANFGGVQIVWTLTVMSSG